MINWNTIDTVLLDMDGTLLDLHFDNHFWQECVPLHYAKRHGLSVEQAKQQLIPLFKQREGTLEWYCLDYWSDALQLDIIGLKAEISDLIAVLPYVIDFLEKLQQSPKRVLLVTNAHRGSLNLKMQKIGLQPFFDGIVCAHEVGIPKEQADFWSRLQQQHAFKTHSTVLIDDNLAVLDSAKQFGIKYLISVSKPDTQQAKKAQGDYPAIEDFRALMSGL
jgi:putative hydrolase of the HAD superfamily